MKKLKTQSVALEGLRRAALSFKAKATLASRSSHPAEVYDEAAGAVAGEEEEEKEEEGEPGEEEEEEAPRGGGRRRRRSADQRS